MLQWTMGVTGISGKWYGVRYKKLCEFLFFFFFSCDGSSGANEDF